MESVYKSNRNYFAITQSYIRIHKRAIASSRLKYS